MSIESRIEEALALKDSDLNNEEFCDDVDALGNELRSRALAVIDGAGLAPEEHESSLAMTESLIGERTDEFRLLHVGFCEKTFESNKELADRYLVLREEDYRNEDYHGRDDLLRENIRQRLGAFLNTIENERQKTRLEEYIDQKLDVLVQEYEEKHPDFCEKTFESNKELADRYLTLSEEDYRNEAFHDNPSALSDMLQQRVTGLLDRIENEKQKDRLQQYIDQQIVQKQEDYREKHPEYCVKTLESNKVLVDRYLVLREEDYRNEDYHDNPAMLADELRTRVAGFMTSISSPIQRSMLKEYVDQQIVQKQEDYREKHPEYCVKTLESNKVLVDRYLVLREEDYRNEDYHDNPAMLADELRTRVAGFMTSISSPIQRSMLKEYVDQQIVQKQEEYQKKHPEYCSKTLESNKDLLRRRLELTESDLKNEAFHDNPSELRSSLLQRASFILQTIQSTFMQEKLHEYVDEVIEQRIVEFQEKHPDFCEKTFESNKRVVDRYLVLKEEDYRNEDYHDNPSALSDMLQQKVSAFLSSVSSSEQKKKLREYIDQSILQRQEEYQKKHPEYCVKTLESNKRVLDRYFVLREEDYMNETFHENPSALEEHFMSKIGGFLNSVLSQFMRGQLILYAKSRIVELREDYNVQHANYCPKTLSTLKSVADRYLSVDTLALDAPEATLDMLRDHVFGSLSGFLGSIASDNMRNEIEAHIDSWIHANIDRLLIAETPDPKEALNVKEPENPEEEKEEEESVETSPEESAEVEGTSDSASGSDGGSPSDKTEVDANKISTGKTTEQATSVDSSSLKDVVGTTQSSSNIDVNGKVIIDPTTGEALDNVVNQKESKDVLDNNPLGYPRNILRILSPTYKDYFLDFSDCIQRLSKSHVDQLFKKVSHLNYESAMFALVSDSFVSREIRLRLLVNGEKKRKFFYGLELTGVENPFLQIDLDKENDSSIESEVPEEEIDDTTEPNIEMDTSFEDEDSSPRSLEEDLALSDDISTDANEELNLHDNNLIAAKQEMVGDPDISFDSPEFTELPSDANVDLIQDELMEYDSERLLDSDDVVGDLDEMPESDDIAVTDGIEPFAESVHPSQSQQIREQEELDEELSEQEIFDDYEESDHSNDEISEDDDSLFDFPDLSVSDIADLKQDIERIINDLTEFDIFHDIDTNDIDIDKEWYAYTLQSILYKILHLENALEDYELNNELLDKLVFILLRAFEMGIVDEKIFRILSKIKHPRIQSLFVMYMDTSKKEMVTLSDVIHYFADFASDVFGRRIEYETHIPFNELIRPLGQPYGILSALIRRFTPWQHNESPLNLTFSLSQTCTSHDGNCTRLLMEIKQASVCEIHFQSLRPTRLEASSVDAGLMNVS